LVRPSLYARGGCGQLRHTPNGPNLASGMRPRLPRLLPLGFLAALLSAGCGGGEELPAKTASAITARLERVDKRVRAGECDDARATLKTLNGQVRDLPKEVDPAVRRTLSRGVDHLGKLVQQDCKQKPEPVEEPAVQPPVVTTPDPPPVTQPEQPQVEEPERPQIERPEKPQVEKPEKPEKRRVEKPKEPTQEEKDICGENPDPRC
jgi:outer membrane biosynthesis protein TonB